MGTWGAWVSRAASYDLHINTDPKIKRGQRGWSGRVELNASENEIQFRELVFEMQRRAAMDELAAQAQELGTVYPLRIFSRGMPVKVSSYTVVFDACVLYPAPCAISSSNSPLRGCFAQNGVSGFSKSGSVVFLRIDPIFVQKR